MMALAGEKFYYTARQVDKLRYDFNKWSIFDDDQPVSTYEIFPFGGPGGRGACGCPAYKRCKHLNALDEILNAGRTSELPYLKWTPEKGWESVEL
jgi:hypothetical protein